MALARASAEIGEPLYQAQPPTGYADRGEGWVNAGALAGAHELRARSGVGPLSPVSIELAPLVAGPIHARPRPCSIASWPRSSPARRGADARRPDGAADRASDHAAVAGRPRPGEYRRRQARRARSRVARVPAAVRGAQGLITRRTFVRAGGARWSRTRERLDSSFGPLMPAGQWQVLVAVFQRGAVDGLSMVMPHGDSGYAAVRPSIALQPPRRGESERAVDLDGFFAFHPALAPLVPLWANRPRGGARLRLPRHDAIALRRAGLHGEWNARREVDDGRLARARRRRTAGEVVAVPGGRDRPGAAANLAGRHRRDLDAVPRPVRRPGRSRRDGARGLRVALRAGRPRSPPRDGRETFDAVKMLNRRSLAPRARERRGVSTRAARRALRQVAQLIKADVGVEVVFADMEGWDTHVDQGADRGSWRCASRLRRGLAAFAQDLGDRMSDVVVSPCRSSAGPSPRTEPRHRPRPRQPRCSSWAAV